MKYLAFNYKCSKCMTEFKAPEVGPWSELGEFLLRDSQGVTFRLNAIKDEVYTEVESIIASIPLLQSLKPVQRAKLLRSIFGVACDNENGDYPQIINKPSCPSCGSNHMEYWEATDPEEIIECQFPQVTHNDWFKLSKEERLSRVEQHAALHLKV